jgi:formyl-CoA transferase
MDKAEFYRDARSDVDGPLHGVRVLDVTTVWSGPMVSCVLADLGADVIRVEDGTSARAQLPPEIPGTGLSWFHQTVNRNKRSVGLDLHNPRSRPAFEALMCASDIVVENFRPGTLDRWGLGYQACRRIKPDIIFVSVSGWGQYGTGTDRRGYDPVLQAESGWAALNGEPQGSALKAPTFLADDLAGLHGAIGALAALRHRDRTGEGQHVDVAMLDTLLFQSSGYLTLAAAGAPPVRRGNEVDFLAPSNAYRCFDGFVYLVVTRDRQWRALAGLIGRPELARAAGLATNDERRANRDEVNRLVGQWCRIMRTRDVVAALTGIGVAAGRVRELAEVAADPQVRDRDLLQRTVLANGTVAELTGPPVKFSRTPTRIRRAAPHPGADTDAVLSTVGIDTEARDDLRTAGAIPAVPVASPGDAAAAPVAAAGDAVAASDSRGVWQW